MNFFDDLLLKLFHVHLCVFVNIVCQKEDVAPLAGYLSLHQNAEGLVLKWTPNQLMNGGSEEDDVTVDRWLATILSNLPRWLPFMMVHFLFEEAVGFLSGCYHQNRIRQVGGRKQKLAKKQ